jgi:Skp family chaperone for outer membrane proteins
MLYNKRKANAIEFYAENGYNTMRGIMNKKQNKLAGIEKEIRGIKQQLVSIGEMRPGSLTRQYHSPKDKKGAFYQLSYTHNMRSRTDYVRKEFVDDLKQQIKNYKRFKKLMKRWVDISIEYSKLKLDTTIKNMRS